MRRRSLALVLGLPLLRALAGAEDVPPPPKPARPVVAVLFLEDRTGDPAHASWRAAASEILSGKLASAKVIRLLGSSAAKRAFKKAGLRVGEAVDAERARQIGEFLEAQRIVFGFYEREGSGFRVSVRVLRTASGTASRDITASGDDWFAICEALALEILRELGLDPSDEDREQIRRRWTSSPAALQSIADAYLARELEEPLYVLEDHSKKALGADPGSAMAHRIAAALASTQGRLLEAEALARTALRLDPSSAGAHRVLGHTLLAQERQAEALVVLREARRLNPDDPETLHALMWLWLVDDPEEALDLMRTAIELDRTDSKAHAALAQVHMMRSEHREAIEAMLDAERFYLGLGGNEAQQFFLSYYWMNDAPNALKHFDDLRAYASRTGLNPEKLHGLESMAERLRPRITPVAAELSLPCKHLAGDLEGAFRDRVGPSELFVNPLAGGPLMKERLSMIVGSRQGELEIARALHDALVARPAGSRKTHVRTALEALAVWDSPGELFVCDDYANLYTALAREAGLEAFYTWVEGDPEGNSIMHACAAVLVEGKVYLADPSYRWFGAPHRSFQVLDDVKAIAAHLLQHDDESTDRVERSRVAVQLWPESLATWASLSMSLMVSGDLKGAREAAEKAIQLSPGHWITSYVVGVLAARDGDFETAERLLRIAVAANPRDEKSHYALANLRLLEHDLEGALDELRAGIRARPYNDSAQEAASSIARIQEHLTSGEHAREELEAVRRRASALEKPPVAE